MMNNFHIIIPARLESTRLKNKENLECHSCKIYYPIEDSIPRMVEEAIKPLNDE